MKRQAFPHISNDEQDVYDGVWPNDVSYEFFYAYRRGIQPSTRSNLTPSRMLNHQDRPIKSPVTRIEGQYLGNPSEVSEVSIAVRRDPDQAASDPTAFLLHGFKLSRIEPQLCCKDASSRAIQRENSLVERSERS